MAAKNHTVTIRMGAAHWDVTVESAGSSTTFDLRKMDRHQRGKFHGQFMAAFRKMQRRGH